MKQYILAIDQGTTSTRCIIFNHNSNIVSIAQKEHAQLYPQAGWVEHDPLEILENTYFVIKSALDKKQLTQKNIASIGITNQRETTVLWNKFTGLPLCNAIVWQDTRTNDICKNLAQDCGQDRFREKTGLPLATYFSGPKIKWVLENVPGAMNMVESGELYFGNIDSFLIWNLTGGIHGGIHVTDVTNASRTMLMNLKTLKWDDEILETMNIPLHILPEIRPSSAIFGPSTTILEGVPIAGVLGDQQAALFGQTCFNPGEAKNTYGTGCFMLLNTGNSPITSKYGLLTTLGYQIGNNEPIYCLEGSIAITGALIQWLRDNMQMISASSEIESLAQTVDDNGGIYFVPAFSGLFAPYWRGDARGVIVGLTRFINRGHVARASLEATAFQTFEVIEAMEKDSGVKLSSLRVDGGMVCNNLLMQFQSNLLNVPVVRPKIAETSSLGAAYAAGLAVGYWTSMGQLRDNWSVEKQWLPDMEDQERVQLIVGWKKAIDRSLNWIN